MQVALIILQQTVCMGLYMSMGYCLYKTGKITDEGSRTIANLLLYLVIPVTIINSFREEFSIHQLHRFGSSLILGVIALLISVVIAGVIFKKEAIYNFAAAFSNAGFIGIPLVQASLGADAVFLLVGMVIALNIMQWTYGSRLLTGDRHLLSLRQFFLNPIMISALLGFILFLTGIAVHLPSVIETCISGIAGLNAPLAMLVLGVYLAQTSVKKLFITPGLYFVSLVRLLLIPAVTLALLYFVPVDTTLKLTILIAASAPAGANVAVYAQIYGKDYIFACKIVAQSTILSILTVPVVIYAANSLWR